MLDDKIKTAQQTLKLAAEMSEYYYHKPLVVCYSGGKDSDVMLDIAKKCLKPTEFEVVNSHTTVDAPETVYHIREVFKKCEDEGIHTEILYPYYKGERTTMWKLIVENRNPPTRIARYCCRILKEHTIPNRMMAVGVREDESVNRKDRDSFTIRTNKDDAEYRSLQHTYAMFNMDKHDANEAYECEMITACKNNQDTICNPIYKFTESDIWEYVKTYDIPMNPLYERGYKRVGCIGCPLGSPKNQKKQFADYPKYKQAYIRAFDKMLVARRQGGMNTDLWQTGEDVFRWWLGENPKQMRIEDFI